MKLSMSMLSRFLKNYQPECHIRDDACTIRGIRFLSDRHPEQSKDYVYLGNASAFFQDPRFQDALILANGHNQILCHSADEEDLLNDVLSAFDYYNSLQQRLYEASVQRVPLSEMLTEAGKVLEGPVFLFDLEGNVVESIHTELYSAYEMNAVLDNVGRIRNLGTGTIANTFVDRAGRVSHDLTDAPQLLHIKGSDDIGCVCLYIRQEGENVGFMLHFPLTEEEAQTSMHVAQEWAGYFAQAAEFAEAVSDRQSDHEILRKLLAGEDVPLSVAEKIRRRLRRNRHLCLILYESHAIRNYTFRKMLANDIEALPLPCIAGECGDYTAVLLAPEDVREVIRFLTGRIPGENLSIGVSMTIDELQDLHAAYEQALLALSADGKQGIRYCIDLAPEFLLRSIREKEQTRHLLHPALRILRTYDRKEKTELEQTLRTYAKEGWRQTESAAVMHIHLNTLKYRLKRITELTGIHFKDPEENFYLQLSVMLEEPLSVG